MIGQGRYQEAVDLLSPLVSDGSATSLDHYAMVKALVGLENLPRAAEESRKALETNGEDGGLTEEQVTELQVLLRRIR